MWRKSFLFQNFRILTPGVCVHLPGLLHAAPYPLEEEVARSLVLTAVLVAAGGLAAGWAGLLAAGLGAAGEVFQLLGISLLL